MEPVRVERTVELDAPVEKVWPVMAYTDRLNRALGLPPVEYTPPPRGGVIRGARSRLLGPLSLRWDEHPFDWVEGKHYRILRVYHGGPFQRFEGLVTFEPRPGGCRLALRADVTPRRRVPRLLARKFAEAFAGMFERAALRTAAAANAGAPDPTVVKKPRPGVDSGFLREAAGRLDASAAVLARLVEHIENADDVEAGMMRPFALADEWGTDRLETLSVFLRAVRGGLLDLRWEVLCPCCRTPKGVAGSLKTLEASAHCEFCDWTFKGTWDVNVELRFSPNPAARASVPKDFCIGGPGKSPHRRAQLRLGAGARREETVVLPASRHVLRGLVSTPVIHLLPDPSAPGRLEVSFTESAPRELRFRPGPVTLALENPGGEAWAALETESWGDKAVTAAFVTTLQEFRDLFSAEVLAPGTEAAVTSLALVFTDLKNSTAMYERVGDARAYAVVRDHFEVLFEVVRRRRGAVVKTIGDAVMAAFCDPADAVAAAREMHEGLIARNAKGGEPVVLKVGVHAGPAIAINAEDVLDYFGTTVNLAARVQAESVGGDVVLTEGVLASPRAAAQVSGGEREGFETKVKGLAASFKLLRWWPQASLDAGLRAKP